MAKPAGIAYLNSRVASQEIEALSQALARLPGLGPRSARRAVLHLMKKRETALQPLLSALQNVADNLSTCSVCGNVDTSDPCFHPLIVLFSFLSFFVCFLPLMAVFC